MAMDLDLVGRKITQALGSTLGIGPDKVECLPNQEEQSLEVRVNAFTFKNYDKYFLLMFTYTDGAWLTCSMVFDKLDKNELNLFLVNEMNRGEPMLTSFIDENNVLRVKCCLPALNLEQVSTQATGELLFVTNALADDGALKLLMQNMN